MVALSVSRSDGDRKGPPSGLSRQCWCYSAWRPDILPQTVTRDLQAAARSAGEPGSSGGVTWGPICSSCTRSSTGAFVSGPSELGDQLPRVKDVGRLAGHQSEHRRQGLPRAGDQGPHRRAAGQGTFIQSTLNPRGIGRVDRASAFLPRMARYRGYGGARRGRDRCSLHQAC